MNGAIPNRWNDEEVQGFSPQELLLYRSNLLGSDLRITNYGGGNTSAKVAMQDPVGGEDVQILWVKGSGGDLGSMGLSGFATLYQSRLLALEEIYRGLEFEDEMVAYLPHCTFNLNTRAASIDTPLHCFVDKLHIDHLHPDALIALAAAKDGERLTQEIFALALESGIEKMVARMTTDQKGAIATFEGLGFRPEALLRDHVKDIDGNTHDLVVMSHSVEEFEQTLAAYGVVENVS